LGLVLPVASVAPILPLVVGDANRTMQLSRLLWENGIFAHGIRPPTVPPGTSRIRMTVLATHSSVHLQQALRVLHQFRAHFPS
jgi:glycine C-acetyltransferase/8-amino-7-oxononanoate synthase